MVGWLGWSAITCSDASRRRKWRTAGVEWRQPGGAEKKVEGAKWRGGVGVLIALAASRTRQGIAGI